MENLINQLTSTHDKDAQVNFLQEIGKKLLTEYVIKIGDITSRYGSKHTILIRTPDLLTKLFTVTNVRRISTVLSIFITKRMTSAAV